MGRWISSLFAAIQGIYSSTVLQSDEVKHDDSHPIVTKPIHQTISDEKLDFIVNVRSLAQKFEKMSTSDGPKTPNIKRTQSSPNLRNVYRRDRDSEVIVIVE